MESSILASFRRGDAGATRDMYRTYGRLVYALAHRVLGHDDLAEEATRRTFVQAWQSAAALDIHRDPAPWLARIAKRTAIDIYRRETRREHEACAVHEARVDPPASTETLDAVWKVRRVLDALPAAERTVLQLQHRDGMSQNEIAARLGLPLNTVKSQSRRAHGQVAKLVGNLRESTI
jgi:RNA polymerase sigma-70 factor (ECF subfamily)